MNIINVQIIKNATINAYLIRMQRLAASIKGLASSYEATKNGKGYTSISVIPVSSGTLATRQLSLLGIKERIDHD